MNKIDKYFALAAKIATKETSHRRKALIGAIGIRNDGAVVNAKNLPNQTHCPRVHAEALLCRKIDTGTVVFVARLNRIGQYANSRPCIHCQIAMRQKGVKKCYYTINETE